ncbi:MAG TPA: hypothetical protein VGW37_04560, partial [Terriglobia bacterium]|nr:hypothetical protein [Terriglobia bacterium]
MFNHKPRSYKRAGKSIRHLPQQTVEPETNCADDGVDALGTAHDANESQSRKSSPGLNAGSVSLIKQFNHVEHPPITSGPGNASPQLQEASRI